MIWSHIKTAPKDETWFLALNRDGQFIVIRWADRPVAPRGALYGTGWIVADGTTYPRCGLESALIAWSPLPQEKEKKALVEQFYNS